MKSIVYPDRVAGSFVGTTGCSVWWPRPQLRAVPGGSDANGRCGDTNGHRGDADEHCGDADGHCGDVHGHCGDVYGRCGDTDRRYGDADGCCGGAGAVPCPHGSPAEGPWHTVLSLAALNEAMLRKNNRSDF